MGQLNLGMVGLEILGSVGLHYRGWEGVSQWDGPGEECEFHVVGSGPQVHVPLLMAGPGVVTSRDKVAFSSISMAMRLLIAL